MEATKFTEVGYHGRDVDSIIKDLLDVSLTLVKELKSEAMREEVRALMEARLLLAVTGPNAEEGTVESFRALLRAGELDERDVEVEVPVKEGSGGGGDLSMAVASDGKVGLDLSAVLSAIAGGGGGAGGARGGKAAIQRRTMKVREARVALEEAELEKRLGAMDLRREAVTLAEQNGIVFIDEIDKLISNRSKHSGDASSEGVQRDLLPLIEGTTIDVR